MATTTIKETLELLDALDAGFAWLAEANKDGSVSFADLLKVLPLLGKMKTAIEGLDKLAAEIKDLDQAELAVLTPRLMATLLAGKAAFGL